MKIVVTGSEGFIGQHLVRALIRDGYDVYGIDKKKDSWIQTWNVPSHDLSRPEAVQLLVGLRPDIIVHLASTCSTLGSVLRPDETFRDTVATNANAIEAARQLEIPYLLTSSVKARDGQTPYGAAKRMNELWAIEYAQAYDMTVVINRPGTIYGPGQEGSLESGWIAWFMKAKREGLPVTIYGDGTQQRDLLHVNDYVKLLLRQINNPVAYAYHVDRRSPIHDVGGGEANTVTVEEVAEYLGLEHTHGHARYGDSPSYVGINRAYGYGWYPETLWRESEVFQEFVPMPTPDPNAIDLYSNSNWTITG